MRNISSAMLSYLSQPIISLATLVLIERTDGVIMGFTDWDVPITYVGVTYEPAIAMSPSGVKINSDLTTDQMDIIGAIDSVYITEQDIDAGRYDLAQITVMLVNPNDLTMGAINELTGTTGQIDYGDGMFTAAVNSLGQQLNQQLGNIVTPVCRVKQLGDSQCKVNINSYRFASSVAGVVDQRTLLFNDTHPTGYYDNGMVRFNPSTGGGGQNYLINMEVKTHTLSGSQSTLLLQEPLPFAVTVGDSCVLEAGCDRRPITCRNKFSNLVNIHCEPYVPGNDYLLLTGRPPS